MSMSLRGIFMSLSVHLGVQVGQFEPVTRRPLQASQLVSNTRLRQATQQYLDDHPWAWKECYS